MGNKRSRPDARTEQEREALLAQLETECCNEVVPGIVLGSQFAAGHRDPVTGVEANSETIGARFARLNITHILVASRFAPGPCPVPGLVELGKGVLVQVTVSTNKAAVPFADRPGVDLKPILSKALPFLHACLQKKQVVLVHCQMGQSRSCAIVCAYLMWANRWSMQEAFAFVKSKRVQVSQGMSQHLLSSRSNAKEGATLSAPPGWSAKMLAFMVVWLRVVWSVVWCSDSHIAAIGHCLNILGGSDVFGKQLRKLEPWLHEFSGRTAD
jgi:hypothetical protein